MLQSQSLAARLVVPLVVTAGLAAMLVAWMSWILGRRWAMTEVAERQAAIESSLRDSSFPLKMPVLESLSHLTGAEWITADVQGRVVASTLDGTPATLPTSLTDRESLTASETPAASPMDWVIDEEAYYAYAFARQNSGTQDDSESWVVALFDKEQVHSVAIRAAVLPLVTGLSTILVVSATMFWVVSRWIGRLRRLESRVARIAAGNFQSEPSDSSNDELAGLASAINRMADQLSELWKQVNRQQSAKLLHQISGGMAHQLRNTLTGAKMAMELHRDALQDDVPEEVRVALRQLTIAEDYVNRLLAVGSDHRTEDRPQSVGECLADVRSTHDSIAKHLKVDLSWTVDPRAEDLVVKDGPSFSAAVSNLLINAMQAGTNVEISAQAEAGDRCDILVSDDGPGLDKSLAESCFDPFVTSKPEGLGLGLPLVKRTAENLGGEVTWSRSDGRTQFELKVAAIAKETSRAGAEASR